MGEGENSWWHGEVHLGNQPFQESYWGGSEQNAWGKEEFFIMMLIFLFLRSFGFTVNLLCCFWQCSRSGDSKGIPEFVTADKDPMETEPVKNYAKATEELHNKGEDLHTLNEYKESVKRLLLSQSSASWTLCSSLVCFMPFVNKSHLYDSIVLLHSILDFCSIEGH